MKLSRLVFECVKDSINIPNRDFNEYSFLNGDFNSDKDYVNQISGVFDALNLALSRLYNSNKIPLFTKIIKVESNPLEFSDGEVINIAYLSGRSFQRIEFRTLNNMIQILDNYFPSKIIIEYKKKIPHFTESDIKSVKLNDENNLIIEDDNIELEDFGITNVMCSYIKSFVKGQLLEYIAPDLANLHNNRAEQYFQDLKQIGTNFYQNKVKNSLKGVL